MSEGHAAALDGPPHGVGATFFEEEKKVVDSPMPGAYIGAYGDSRETSESGRPAKGNAMSGHSNAQARSSVGRQQSPSEASATSIEEDFEMDADIDEDIGFDVDSPEMDAYWIGRAEEAWKGGFLSAEETRKQMEKYLKC